VTNGFQPRQALHLLWAVPVALIPWLKPRTVRIILAVPIGALWGLLVAIVTHGIFPWQIG